MNTGSIHRLLNSSLFRLFLWFALVGLNACDKEHSSRVKYEVNCPSGCNVTYLTTRMSVENNVNGSWSRTFNISHGEPFFLSAVKTSAFGNALVTVFIDGESFAVDQNNAPFGAAVVEGTVPEN